MADCTCDQINKIDVDGDGTIGALHTGGLTSSTSLTTGLASDFEEYLQMMCMQMKTRDSEEEIMGAMQRMFDAENTCVVRGRCLHNAFSHQQRRTLVYSGYISKKQLRIVLDGVGHRRWTLGTHQRLHAVVFMSAQLGEDVTDSEYQEICDEVDVGGGLVDYKCVRLCALHVLLF